MFIRYPLLVLVLSSIQLVSFAQPDSTVSYTKRHVRDGEEFYREHYLAHYFNGKLVFERKDFGLDREEISYETKTYYYDLNGELFRIETVEADQHECPPEPDRSGMGLVIDVKPFYVPGVDALPDSVPDVKYCGMNKTVSQQYWPYMQVIKTKVQYNEDDATYAVDTLFFNRYKDLTRKVTYNKGKKYLEYRYKYTYDGKGRMTEQIWDNLTVGNEFKQTQKFEYINDEKKQVYYSMIWPSKHTRPHVSTTTYNADGSNRLHQNFSGDSLVSTYHYVQFGNTYRTIELSPAGDTINTSEHARIHLNHGVEAWGLSSRSGDYTYSKTDTTFKKDGYTVEFQTYRISKEQFDKRVSIKNNPVLFRERNLKKYDGAGRLIYELDADRDKPKEEIFYEYKKAR